MFCWDSRVEQPESVIEGVWPELDCKIGPVKERTYHVIDGLIALFDMAALVVGISASGVNGVAKMMKECPHFCKSIEYDRLCLDC